MSNLARSLRDVVETAPTGAIYAGEIHENASAVDDQIQVIIPSFDSEKTWGPCRWPTRVDDAGDTVLPNKGDSCVVALAESDSPGMQEIWILVWWPE